PALLGPHASRAREHPCRAGTAVVVTTADDGSIPVRRQRYGASLLCGSHRSRADQFAALLSPNTCRASVNPRGTSRRRTDDSRVSVAGYRNGFSKIMSARNGQFAALLCPDAAGARIHPHGSDSAVVLEPGHERRVPIRGQRNAVPLIGVPNSTCAD